MPTSTRVLLASDRRLDRLRRAFERAGHTVTWASMEGAVDAVGDGVEAVVVAAPRTNVLSLARRLKTRFQVPLLPVVALVSRPAHPPEEAAPDVWLAASTPPGAVVERIEELVRIRRAEGELVRLNGALAGLAAENGRLYERARRDAAATNLLLRELQHRVRNNLAAIQALLVLERHRTPPRALPEAIDVAIARLRGMAALQDSLLPHEDSADLAALAKAVARGALEVFGASDRVQCVVTGGALLPSRRASPLAIVLNELLTNALKHAHAQTVRVDIRESADALELEVCDNGRGMPAGAGTGSGLMIVRAVMKNELAGSLSFMPCEQGTRIHIRIPRDGEPEAIVPR
ncbi:MAG: sensor histidine kinase [Gemmatimonadaceae bacterium]